MSAIAPLHLEKRDHIILGAKTVDEAGGRLRRNEVDARFKATARHFGTAVTTVMNNALPDCSFNGDARRHASRIGWNEFTAQLEGVWAAFPAIPEARFGRIISIGSNLFQNLVPYHDYTAANDALLSLTRTFSAEIRPDGITVNMVSGGLLRTTDASRTTLEAVYDVIAANTPLRHVTTPEEFADAVPFFASPSRQELASPR